MAQPLLSIGMIVKNEERCLEKCLKALEPLRQAISCELVIADTGSTDKTREIASKYADILFDFEWINDFSAARNAVMDKCSGRWYLTVDADEYLNSPIDELVEFLTGTLGNQNIYASIVQRNFSNPDMSGLYTDFNAIRMVRMDTKKRYEGAIHEAFPYIELERTHILTNTIFDHDGYAELTPEHLKKKAERNLQILEKELTMNPNNLRCISQCLEVVGPIPEKRKYYAQYAIEKLKVAQKNDEYIDGFGPSCAKEAIKYMLLDKHANVETIIEWVLKRFPKSYEVLIDVNFLYAVNLYEKKDFQACVKYCKAYLSGYSSYINRKITSSYETFVSTITFSHNSHKHEIQLILANALINSNQFEEAYKYLEQFDLSELDKKNATNWYSTILMPQLSKDVEKTVGSVINQLLDKHAKNKFEYDDAYKLAISTISKVFSCSPDNNLNYNIFAKVSGTIGISVKIINSNKKTEIEKYIKEIDNWEEIMPLALKKVLTTGITLPKEFFLISPERLNLFSKELLICSNDIINPIHKVFCDQKNQNNFFNISFLYNLFLTIIFTTEFDKLDANKKHLLSSDFFIVADIYLNTLFNTNILENETLFSWFSKTHFFSYTFVKATNLKKTNYLEYVKTLRYALQKVPEAKNFVEFLIEDFKREEDEKKKQQIKLASPELVSIAEQLKVLLSKFPENSPELLAIKESSMYKQVAFLIED